MHILYKIAIPTLHLRGSVESAWLYTHHRYGYLLTIDSEHGTGWNLSLTVDRLHCEHPSVLLMDIADLQGTQAGTVLQNKVEKCTMVVSWGTVVVSWGTVVVSLGTVVVSWGTVVVSWGTVVVSWGTTVVVSWGTVVVSWGTVVVSWATTVVVSWGTVVVSWGTVVVSLGTVVVSWGTVVVSWGTVVVSLGRYAPISINEDFRSFI